MLGSADYRANDMLFHMNNFVKVPAGTVVLVLLGQRDKRSKKILGLCGSFNKSISLDIHC